MVVTILGLLATILTEGLPPLFSRILRLYINVLFIIFKTQGFSRNKPKAGKKGAPHIQSGESILEGRLVHIFIL
jgi:hypothetical protein